MKTKCDTDITKLLYRNVFFDLNPRDNNTLTRSPYLLFVKDISYLNNLSPSHYDPNNKLLLVIVSEDDGYLINNDFRFNSLEVIDNVYCFYTMVNNKRKETKFYL